MNQPTQPNQTGYPAKGQSVKKDRWYDRAGRKTAYVIRKSLLPLAIALGVSGAGYAGFEIGRAYQQVADDNFSQSLLEEKVERGIIRRGGKLYMYEERESHKLVPLDALQQSKQAPRQQYIRNL